jgi:hypothetical protein
MSDFHPIGKALMIRRSAFLWKWEIGYGTLFC